MFRLGMVVLLLMGIAFCEDAAFAKELTEAEKLFHEAEHLDKEKKYTDAFRKYELAAEAGHLQAGRTVAKRLRHGIGVEKDIARSLELNKKLFRNGIADALCEMGIIYAFNKDGFEHDYAKALECFREAIAKGSKQNNHYYLGLMYYRGLGVPKDTSEGIRLWQVGTERGESMSQCALGEIYHYKSEPRDYAKAKELYEKSIHNGLSFAYSYLGILYEQGLGVDSDIKKASEFYEKSKCGRGYYQLGILIEKNKGGIVLSRYNVSTCYRKSAELNYAKGQAAYGRKQLQSGNVASALEWIHKSVAQKCPEGMFELGKIYEDGVKGVPRNYETAREWYEKAAAGGHRKAEIRLGWLALNGRGMSMDIDVAYDWFEKHAGEGKEKQFEIAEKYRKGEELPKDAPRALKWYEKAAQNGHMEAEYFLGKHCLKMCEKWDAEHPENGVSCRQSAAWFLRAAMQGHSIAQMELGRLFEKGKGGAKRSMPQAYMMYNLARAGGEANSIQRMALIEEKYPDDADKGQRMTEEWLSKYPDSIDRGETKHIFVD